MDKETLTILRADIRGHMGLIEDIFGTLEQRAAGLDAGDDRQLESVAYQLHNLYNAIEDLFKIVAGHFENRIADTSRWHVELLQRMRQEIDGVRPALLSRETFALLNGLRSFRHFFRHAYATPIEHAQLLINLDKARKLRPLLERDVNAFLEQLERDAE